MTPKIRAIIIYILLGANIAAYFLVVIWGLKYGGLMELLPQFSLLFAPLSTMAGIALGYTFSIDSKETKELRTLKKMQGEIFDKQYQITGTRNQEDQEK